jgi:outer membrane protein assembly factor BamB
LERVTAEFKMATSVRIIKLHWVGFLAALSLLALANAGQAEEVDPLDWPNWRGPQQNSQSTETGLIDGWNPRGGEGSNLVWKNEQLGTRSSPIVLGGKLYTLCRDHPGTKNECEKVVCADAATGKILWEHRFNVYLSDVPDTRVGWSSCVADPETGRIYAQGVCGYFCCLEGDTGKVVWERSLHEEFGLISTYGGRTNVPVVFEDTVLTSAVIVGWGDEPKWGNFAKPAHRFICFDKASGEVRWMAGTSISPYDTTYSTPTIAVLGGQAALVFGSGDGGVWALQPRTGKPIWHYPFSRRGLNISPLVTADGRVYMSHSEENIEGNSMGAAVALDGTMTGDLSGRELWLKLGIMAGKSSPLLIDGKLYLVEDGAKLCVLDAETGEQLERKALGTAMRSTPVYADGKLYLCTNGGRWYIFKPTASGLERVDRQRLRRDQNDGSPAVSHGRIYLPTSEAMYCIGAPDVEPSAAPLPKMPAEAPASADPEPALVQVVPYDVLLSPGDEQDYHVRLFNSRGRLLREVPAEQAEFSVVGIGKITGGGRYTAPADAGHDVALVKCQVGELTGTARVRVVPSLPWRFDFNYSDLVPLTWLGGRVRWEVREQGGERFIVKRTVLPTPKNPNNKLGTRSYFWMGPIDLSNYTIQADVLLTEENGRISDVGLINSRYMLRIRGLNRQLRLESWTSSDHRTSATSEFDPHPDHWYTMKLTVEPGDGQATARGKIWPRGQPEPDKWNVEMVDHSPNLHGTPGVYGNSPDAEIYLDNLIVTPN